MRAEPVQLDVFAKRNKTARRHSRQVERLIPLARTLAFDSPAGLTVSELRKAAVERGYLTGRETGRQLSYLGAVMKAAGLRATERFARSGIEQSKGNLHRIWEYAR